MLTSFSDDETVFPAIKAGALGYMLKNTSPEQIIERDPGCAPGQAIYVT